MQKYPAAHGFDVAAVEPSAKPEPAVLATHEVDAMNEAPPVLKVPAGHALAVVAVLVPAGQK